VIPCEYGASELPEPRLLPPADGARVPNVSLHVPGFVLEYRNHAVDDEPPGFADPFKVAPVLVTDDAAFVVATGTAGEVVSGMMLPNDVQALF